MMKKINYIYQILLVAFIFGLTSCDDWFDIRPQSETILEDYWRDESDVKSAVASCYRGMIEGGFVDRLLVWGEVRSDNVIAGPKIGDSADMGRILSLMLNTTNSYTSWFDFYRVINYCNTIILYAEDAWKRDPNFSEGQLRSYIAEVKGIRALCYFTLIRAFRDIPFSTEPIFDDSHSFELAQDDPDSVIKFLIQDLKGVEDTAPSGFDKVEYDQGRITRKAILALIADMALWVSDYETCIEYCDKILAEAGSRLRLEPSSTYYRNLFGLSTSSEIIFNLQFTTFPNDPVRSAYQEKLSSFDFMKSGLFGVTDAKDLKDLRGMDFFRPIADASGVFPIVKYVGVRTARPGSTSISTNDYSLNSCYSWIFYRLADVYLMRAEALVERNSGNDLQEAFDMVSITFKRANPELVDGTFAFSSYESQGAMRNLVFDERQREFLFEGKRYFDLLRRMKREGSTTNITNYLLPKYGNLNDGTVLGKIGDKDALYMPINEDEMKVNTLLIQNPFYFISSDISRN